MAKSGARAQPHVTQKRHLVAITPTFFKFCSLASETQILLSSVLGCTVSP